MNDDFQVENPKKIDPTRRIIPQCKRGSPLLLRCDPGRRGLESFDIRKSGHSQSEIRQNTRGRALHFTFFQPKDLGGKDSIQILQLFGESACPRT